SRARADRPAARATPDRLTGLVLAGAVLLARTLCPGLAGLVCLGALTTELLAARRPLQTGVGIGQLAAALGGLTADRDGERGIGGLGLDVARGGVVSGLDQLRLEVALEQAGAHAPESCHDRNGEQDVSHGTSEVAQRRRSMYRAGEAVKTPHPPPLRWGCASHAGQPPPCRGDPAPRRADPPPRRSVRRKLRRAGHVRCSHATRPSPRTSLPVRAAPR